MHRTSARTNFTANLKINVRRREKAWLGPASRFKFQTSSTRHLLFLPVSAALFFNSLTVVKRRSRALPARLTFVSARSLWLSFGAHFLRTILCEMGPRSGFAAQLHLTALHITVSQVYKGHNVLYDAMILVHRQVAHFAVELDQNRTLGLKMTPVGFRAVIIDIVARGIGIMCVFDGTKLPGKIVNHNRTLRVTRYRVMLDELRAHLRHHNWL